MSNLKPHANTVLLIGSDEMSYSIAVCLLQHKYKVDFLTDRSLEAELAIKQHAEDIHEATGRFSVALESLSFIDQVEDAASYLLAIIHNKENLQEKIAVLHDLEDTIDSDLPVLINFESYSLSELQEACLYHGRLLGCNWAYPAHTTYFQEIISNAQTHAELADEICELSKSWDKDPYCVPEKGIRSKMMSALVREAFYLVENGYASVEDIDRACRNDAGYYLPFAGNCRYMDLMGGQAYGTVMKDLNPELSTNTHLPSFFTELIRNGNTGMESNRGVYNYTDEDVDRWKKLINEFAYKIQPIINKYPFNY